MALQKTAKFRLVQSARYWRVHRYVVLILFCGYALWGLLIDHMNLYAVVFAIVGILEFITIAHRIKKLEPDQHKWLTLTPEGVAYEEHGVVQWRVGWDELGSVVFRREMSTNMLANENLFFITKSGEERSIPIYRFNEESMPWKSFLTSKLKAAGFPPKIEKFETGSSCANPPKA